MSEVYVNGERKRRLPLWMLGVTVPDQVEKSRSKDDENISSTKLNSLSKALKPKVTRVAKRVEKAIDGKDTLEVDSSLLVKDEAKKRVKKTRRKELDHDDLVNSEDGLPKKRMKKGVDVIKRKTKESTLSKKRNQKSIGPGSGEEPEDLSLSEDDEELTVEDIVSIAEEYVEADRKKGHQKQAINEHESAQLPAVSDFSRNEIVGSIGDAQSSRVLPADITMGPSSTDDMIRSQYQVSSASNGGSNPSQTGDPAQDMLDLFLGPLLKKPQTEERKPDFITHDISLEREFRKHSGYGILGEKVVALTKKKSSLKDKSGFRHFNMGGRGVVGDKWSMRVLWFCALGSAVGLWMVGVERQAQNRERMLAESSKAMDSGSDNGGEEV